MSDKLKKLTGKNPNDFEPVAYSLINNPDVELFCELVEKDDFLFDFVKQNVASRLEKVCNESNYQNLLSFFKYYSPSYEDFIISTLVKYADEDLTDKMLELFENGTDDEKTYCAKYFSYIQDPLSLDFLNKNAYSENPALASNCASTLGVLKDEESYNKAISMLNSDDEFTCLDGVKFLVSYGNKNAVGFIIDAVKKSSMAENMAGELLYLTDLFTVYKNDQREGLFIANLIINGLGEILGLAQVFDFQLYEFLETVMKSPKTSASAAVLLNAADKFETLTENDEYLFDETKETKQEIQDIKKLLSGIDMSVLYGLVDEELNEKSEFVFTALDFTENEESMRMLLKSSNPAVVIKVLEVLKQFESLTPDDKTTALNSVSDENIKNVIMAI